MWKLQQEKGYNMTSSHVILLCINRSDHTMYERRLIIWSCIYLNHVDYFRKCYFVYIVY